VPSGGGAAALVRYRGRDARFRLPAAELAGAARVRIDWGDGTFSEVAVSDLSRALRRRHRYLDRSVDRHRDVTYTTLAADGSVLRQGTARTRNERWVIETYRRIFGIDPSETSLAVLSDELDDCRSLSATRRKIQRQLNQQAASS
jgi:hypothetical protein